MQDNEIVQSEKPTVSEGLEQVSTHIFRDSDGEIIPTHTFKLLSGPECEVSEFKGADSELFTKANIASGKFIELMLLSIIKRIGSVTVITPILVRSLLSGDRSKILFEARQFTQDFPKTYEIEAIFGSQKQRFSFNVCDIEQKPYLFQCEEYEQVLENQKVSVLLPKCKKKVHFYLLDGKMEENVRKINPDKANFLTQVRIRKPSYVDAKGTELLFNLETPSLSDINFLNAEMIYNEGTVDTSARIVNQNDVSEEKYINLMAMRDFFFPSLRSLK